MKYALSIKSRLFLATAAILGCSYVILFLLSISVIKSFVADEIAKNLEISLRFAKSQFNSRPELVLEALNLQASSAETKKLLKSRDTKMLEKVSDQWSSKLDFLEMLTFVDANQRVISRINSETGQKSFLQSYLIPILFERKQPIVTTELVSLDQFCAEVSTDACMALPKQGDVMLQLIMVPVIGANGELLGAIIAGDDINKDQHLPNLQQKVFGKSVEMIITRHGEQIATTMSGVDAVMTILEDRVLQSLKGGYRFIGTTVINGRQFEMIAESIHNHKGEFIGSLAVAILESDFSSLSHQNLQNFVTAGILSFVFIMLLSYFTAWKLTAPLRRLSEAATAIELGVFPVKLEESGSSEFKGFADTFNKMTEVMEEREKSIRAQNELLIEVNRQLEISISEQTERGTSEIAVQMALINGFPEGVVISGRDCRIIRMNEAAVKLLGDGACELPGKELVSICEAFDLPELKEIIRTGSCELDAGSELVMRQENLHQKLLFRVTGIRDEKGAFNGLLLRIRDITVEGEVDRLKEGFMSKVSHELKTPLTSMKGSLQFILKKGKWLTGMEREMLDVCLRNTERLIGLIAGIIELTRVEAGQIKFERKALQIGEVVLYQLEEMKGAALVRNISLVNDIPMDLPKVYGDNDRIGQVLNNLLSNAIKFSAPDSVVTLSAEVLKGFMAVSVGDSSKAIPSECREALFSRFQQIAAPEDGEYSGSGIGLALCKEIISRHGGSIYHTPGVSGGNIFTFTLPLYGEQNGKG